MSLVSNARDVSFTTRWPTDKIVGVWEGSFDRSSDVIIMSGDLGDIYVHRIEHGFTRPVFTDLLWKISADWADGGSADSVGDISIAFADSTYIYIVSSVFAPAVGTMYYKVIGTWIRDYDNSNPLVNSFLTSNKETVFDTRVNYQKVYDQNVKSFSSSSTQSVTHGLGYRPNYRVFFEANTGQVWPMFAGGVANPFLYDSGMSECYASSNTITLDISMDFVTATKRAWYKIYLDN